MLAMLVMALALSTQAATGTLDTMQTKRIRAVEDSLLSPCCYGAPVSTHMSGIAAQMREEITQMVVEGKSDAEIRQVYVQRYGQQVLAEPPGAKGVILYALPVGVAFAGVFVVILFLRRALKRRYESNIPYARPSSHSTTLSRVRADVGEI